MAERVLVVEDERAIADAIQYALGAAGYDVDSLHHGAEAARADVDRYDVVILDVMLPGVSGVELCRRFREQSAVPIIMLTARTGTADRVLGLETGADDYLTKPFAMAELVSRVRAALRRRALDRAELTTLQVGAIAIDLEAQAVSVDGRPVHLTPVEFRLLALLAGRPGQTLTRREILTHIWDTDFVADERACDAHVKNLRRKIEADPRHPQRVLTARGAGYLLSAD